jgi:hypothetical protein
MLHTMSDAINLADPSFEPSDEQLEGLASRAFASVAEAHEKVYGDLPEWIERVGRALSRHPQFVDLRAA